MFENYIDTYKSRSYRPKSKKAICKPSKPNFRIFRFISGEIKKSMTHDEIEKDFFNLFI